MAAKREAAEAYRKALYLDPNHHEALVHLALLLAKQGDRAGARCCSNARAGCSRRAGSNMPEQPNIASGATPITIDDCWNRIGVRGDGSCPELSSTFTAATVRFTRQRPWRCSIASCRPTTSTDWTSHFAQEQRIEQLDTHSVVIFRIGAEWLALPTPVFKEVAELRAIHSLPHRRGGVVLGLANVRGELLVCVSLGTCSAWRTRPSPTRARAAYCAPAPAGGQRERSAHGFPRR